PRDRPPPPSPSTHCACPMHLSSLVSSHPSPTVRGVSISLHLLSPQTPLTWWSRPFRWWVFCCCWRRRRRFSWCLFHPRPASSPTSSLAPSTSSTSILSSPSLLLH